MVFKTADVVKAEGGVRFGQKGLMMELQSLQEALKVEIQIHQKLVAQMKQDPQNAELKLQLHDLQAKITGLSERQKKVVEQLRRDLLVKQDSADIGLQTQTQHPLQADGKTTTLISNQTQSSLPPNHLNTSQNSVSVTPVITTKTLPLMLRAATPTTPIAMMPTPTIAMVTTLTNTPRPSLPNSDPQSLSLQATGKPAHHGLEPVRIVPKNTIVVMPKTSVASAALPPILAQQPVLLTAKLSSALLPSTGPVHQLHILHPQPANTQPGTNSIQSCPGNAQPGFNIIQPCPSITMTLSTNLAQFSTSSTQHTTQLPSILISAQANKPYAVPPAQAHADPPAKITDVTHATRSDLPCPDTQTPGTVDRVVPKTSASSPTTCPAPPQTQVPFLTTSKTHIQANTPSAAASQPTKPKCPDNPLKLAFMLSLGLVTQDYLDEIQSKRQERKRRTTANPVYSGAFFEPERKKSTVSYLSSANQGCRKRGRPPKPRSVAEQGISRLTPTGLHPACVGPRSPASSQSFSSHSSPSNSPRLGPSSVGDGAIHDDFCVVCRRGGQLLMCDACSGTYHHDCLAPPLLTVPRGMWICPACQHQIMKTDEAIEWPGALAIVHSYISYKAEKEQEKLKLEKWSSDLQQEREELEIRAKQLSNSITVCSESRKGVLARQRDMEASIEKVKGLVRLIRGIQLPPLSQFTPVGTVFVNPGAVSTQQPHTVPSSEENQQPCRNNITGQKDKTNFDHRDTSILKNTHSNVSDLVNNEDATDTKNSSTVHSFGRSTSPVLSNTHTQSTTYAGSNRTLEREDGHEETKNQVGIGETNKNSIRNLRGTAEPLPIVVQGVE
ncbi:PHD finger protein 21Aa [Trichomycterus rosablanca]|uniref:PHD finger protein 21Aa n=1 Tax=Trichomycterus rosablanca TaxID=2290929 RepID=UPI002F359168